LPKIDRIMIVHVYYMHSVYIIGYGMLMSSNKSETILMEATTIVTIYVKNIIPPV